MVDGQRDRSGRRRLQAEIEPGHHAARDVDRKGQPRPLDRPAVHRVDDKDIDRRVIDLDDVKRVIGAVFRDNRLKPVPRRFRAFAGSDQHAPVDRGHPRLDGLARRRRDRPGAAQLADMVVQRADGRLLAFQIIVADRLFDQRLDIIGKTARPPRRTRLCGEH